MSTNNQPVENQNNGLNILMMLFWLLFGNFILCISAIGIYLHKGSFFHAFDLVFWVTVIVLILVRYLDIKHLGGMTITGRLATPAHWIRYTIFLLIFSAALWAIAHAVNYFVVNK